MINLNTGSVLIGERGQYSIINLIGEGGMARVFSASSALIDVVAAKVLHEDFAIMRSSPTTTPGSSARTARTVGERFKREAGLLKHLNHPHLAGFIDMGLIEAGEGNPPVPFIVSEFVEGQPLDLVIHEQAKMLRILKCGTNEAGELYERFATPGEVPTRLSEPFFKISMFIRIARALCSALAYIHKEGVVHRDIKPENVMIRLVDGHVEVVKLLDLGIAWMSKDLQQQIGSDTTLTRESIIGTPFFMPPEQCLGGTVVGPTFDVFSLGMVLYIMLTGRHPNRNEQTLPSYYLSVNSTSPYDPGLLADGIPEELRMLVVNATRPNPGDRYKTAFEMLQVINRVESSLLDARNGAVPTRTIESTPPPARRGGIIAWIGMGAFLLGLAGGAYYLVQRHEAQNEGASPAPTARSAQPAATAQPGTPRRSAAQASRIAAISGPSPETDVSPTALETVRNLCTNAKAKQSKGAPANMLIAKAHAYVAAFKQTPECSGL